jgi:hypothetical protein
VADGHLYWADQLSGTITEAKPGRTDPQVIISGQNGPIGLAIGPPGLAIGPPGLATGPQ